MVLMILSNVMRSFIRDLREYDENTPPTETWPSTGDMISHAAEELERLSAENKRLWGIIAVVETNLVNLQERFDDHLNAALRHIASVSTGLTKAPASPKTAIEKDGINDRGSDQYASPCTHFSKMSINGQVQCYDCGKYFDDE